MATARTAMQGLLSQLTPLFTGLTPTVKAAVGWPSMLLIQSVAKKQCTLVAVYDAGDGAKNATRWAGQTIGILDVAPPAPGVTAAVSETTLAGDGTATITLSGAPNVADAVVFSAQPVDGAPALLSNATATSGSTLTSMATALAASINTADLYGITASGSGAVVTVAGSSSPLVLLGANTGNVGTRTRETKRMMRHVRVIVWGMSEAVREAFGNPIDVQLGKLDDNGGFYLSPVSPGPLGDYVAVHSLGDMYVEDQLADIYRWDFRVGLEYGTLDVESLYPVLGTSLSFAFSQA
jgi:hypothetical protein